MLLACRWPSLFSVFPGVAFYAASCQVTALMQVFISSFGILERSISCMYFHVIMNTCQLTSNPQKFHMKIALIGQSVHFVRIQAKPCFFFVVVAFFLTFFFFSSDKRYLLLQGEIHPNESVSKSKGFAKV